MKVTKFDVVLNIWVAFLISAVLSIVLPLIAKGGLTVGEFFSGLGISFVLSFVLVLVLPIVQLGDKFAAACSAKPHTMPRQLLTTVVLALIMGVIMSLVMNWWGLHAVPGYENFYWSAWLKSFPFALIVIYIMANISLSTGIPLTKKILGIPQGPPSE